MRFDPTPLPPHRPPTREFQPERPRRRSFFLRLFVVFALVLSGTMIVLLLEQQRQLDDALAEARDEAASLRKALFRTEDELKKLKSPAP